ncbi:bifunctional phosphoglucose/phosphomannose isomerase [Paraconexibacter antarcticus]|uniref:Bifunctional phosphoglucose/phosphomannose isomerase n=1 Tax=Paraconexibacter antarcticus TaxID=2949664 RepID=A0ABY5DXJ8_9ACTN|nr:SIS domain-containing protein [Paraconexibacter antarcticus]UTI65851.1 bifunctional phosphoglucose/phosphomannose isomerase [Paraconexibacter antarcticus]
MSSTDTTADLGRETVSANDPTDQITDVLALPELLRDALWKVESAGLKEIDSPGGMVFAGMGATATAGLLARAALADHASLPILPARAYGLPVWTTPQTTVLCASYSGDTEETLACYEAAGALGAPRVVVTTGGQLAAQARADGVPVIPVAGGLAAPNAVAYMLVAALEVAAQCGAGPRMTSEIDVAAEHLEDLVVAWGPDSPEDSAAKSLARALHGSVPVISGAGLTVPLAVRFKQQLNHIAQTPAFAAELPDADHAELAGWAGADTLGRFSAVFLDDCDTHPRAQARLALSKELIAPHVVGTHLVATRGQTAVERVLSLVLFGDLVAHYWAVLSGVDPGAETPVEMLKADLIS